jgi:hypothetical protein
MNEYLKYDKKKDLFHLNVKLKPAAKQDIIENFIKVEDKYCLKIKVKAPPVEGKANMALISLLSKSWNIQNHNIQIIGGLTSQYKTITIKNSTQEYLKSILLNYIKDIDNQIKLEI